MNTVNNSLSALTSLGGSVSGGNTNGLLAMVGGSMLVFMVIILWSLVWKGAALWYAARRGEKGWFIALLILNTVGILEIIYIFSVAKRSDVPGSKPNSSIQPPNDPRPPLKVA